jgi:hypothetical protein
VVEVGDSLHRVCQRIGSQFVRAISSGESYAFWQRLSQDCAWVEVQLASEEINPTQHSLLEVAADGFRVFDRTIGRVMEGPLLSGLDSRALDPAYWRVTDTSAYLIAQELRLGVVLRWIERERLGEAAAHQHAGQVPLLLPDP